MSNGVVIAIDLGTTNSSVSVVQHGRPRLIAVDGSPLLPSVVGLDTQDHMLVGTSARNQHRLYPERTVRSVKRHMGTTEELSLGEQRFSPVELSAMILRRLARAAEESLGEPVERAVITVPAYFSDAQRTATREAGEVAGLRVERILNEPTAAALCYGLDEQGDRTLLVYDLGGGTFDVSIVRSTGTVTEVLSSHGDTALGGDDFDAALVELLAARFQASHGVDPRGDRRAMARLARAAEEAKIRLSAEQQAPVLEEHLLQGDGASQHLDEVVTRAEFEALIAPWLERTKDSVHIALREAGLLATDLDEVILVGGSTRIPLVGQMLEDLLGRPPRCDVEPEAAVALGAALQAARISGERQTRILVDVTPFSFGTSYLGTLGGYESPHCYRAIIERNTALPAQRRHTFYTVAPGQAAVDVTIFQGHDEDSRNNLSLGRFRVDGLDEDAWVNSPIDFELSLDLDGILHVTVVEQHTGLAKKVVIADAFRKLSREGLTRARKRVLAALGEEEGTEPVSELPADAPDGAAPGAALEVAAEASEEAGAPLSLAPAWLSSDQQQLWARALAARADARRRLATLEEADQVELEDLLDELQEALDAEELAALQESTDELSDVLFYLE